MLTDEQIDELATLNGAQAAERVRLQARHGNEREQLLQQQASERAELMKRLGIAPMPDGNTENELPGAPGNTALERAPGGAARPRVVSRGG